MTVRRALVSAVLTLLLLPAATSGQTVNGAITGVIKDATGGVVADVAVTLRNIATDQTIATTLTNASGEYSFRNLPPASTQVEAIKSGFQQVTHARHRRDAELGAAGGNRAAGRGAGLSAWRWSAGRRS